MSTVVDGPLIGVVRVHGGVKFYRGAARAARAYVERDRSRADDYYLAEGSGVAERLQAAPGGVEHKGTMDGDTYERWVAGIDVDTGAKKGRIRDDEHALRFVEVTVNGPKTWSLAAALHPDISAALDAAQERAATEIVGWVAARATTRVGPRGRQVQVPVEKIEAAVIHHYTSRAGDPHRHLHLQINARVYSAGGWRGLHSVGFRDSIEAINGIGHAAVATDPEFRAALATHGFTLDPDTSEIRELAPYAGAFSARSAQIRRNVDRYEAERRSEHPGEEPGPKRRELWDRRGMGRGSARQGDPTRRVASSSNGGTRSCAISATAIRARPFLSEARRRRGSTATPRPRKNLGDEMLTLDETAALLRVPENTLRYWRVIGAGPRSFKVGRHVRYWRSDVVLWVTEQMNRPQGH